MTISLKHKFTSAKADGTDSTLIQPSNWNDTHDLLMATSRLIGRTTAGTGAAEEISVGSNLTLTGGVLDVASGVYQPLDAELTAIAGLTSAADTAPYFTGSGTAALMASTAVGRTLMGAASASAQRTALGLVIGTDVLPVNSPAMTGTPTAPTATAGTNTTQVATTAFVTAALSASGASQTTYTSGSGSWTVPSSGTYVLVRMWGGGGSGCQTGAARYGGGGGAYKEALYLRSSLGASVSYSVGAGGAAVSGTNGNPGGNTTFGSLTAYGGGGGGGTAGTGGGYIAAGGTGTDPGWGGSGIGTGANAALPWSGANGGNNANPGGAALYGGAGGGGVTSSTATAGGTSIFGGNGGAAISGGTATSGSAPGGGGGAASGTGTSGAGGAGRIDIYVW